MVKLSDLAHGSRTSSSNERLEGSSAPMMGQHNWNSGNHNLEGLEQMGEDNWGMYGDYPGNLNFERKGGMGNDKGSIASKFISKFAAQSQSTSSDEPSQRFL